MLMLNALIKAQSWLLAAIAALGSPTGGAAGEEFTDEATGAAPSADEPEVPLADEDDPSLRATCYDDHFRPRRGHCLAKCDDSRRFRAVSGEMRIEGNHDWCRQRARRFCRDRRDRLDDWCWGRRSGGGWDDDDHDDWDDDDGWDHDDHDDGHGHHGR